MRAMAAETEPRPQITKVWARNFRSIEYAELELGPLTVLVGPNASGKSNLLDVLGFLSDAARDGLEMALNKRGGIDSISRRSPSGKVLASEIGFQVKVEGRTLFPGIDFSAKIESGTLEYSVSLAKHGKGEYRVKREYAKFESTDPGVASSDVELTNGRPTKPNLKRVESEIAKDNKDKQNLLHRWGKELIEGLDNRSLHLMSGEPRWLNYLDYILPMASQTRDNPYYTLGYNLEDISRDLGRLGMYHIFPNSLRDPQKAAESHPLATDGENLASTLRDMIRNENRFLPDLKEALSVAVPGIRDIRVVRAGSYYVVELKHERDDGTDKGLWLDLSYESDGTIRLLAMLTAIFQDPAPSLIGLEEPELAIHPGAMAVLADVMKEASLRGQVVVATHSPELINHLPVESIRAVTAEGGSTKVGKVSESQMKSLKQKLFTAGELHSMEGLYPVGVE